MAIVVLRSCHVYIASAFVYEYSWYWSCLVRSVWQALSRIKSSRNDNRFASFSYISQIFCTQVRISFRQNSWRSVAVVYNEYLVGKMKHKKLETDRHWDEQAGISTSFGCGLASVGGASHFLDTWYLTTQPLSGYRWQKNLLASSVQVYDMDGSSSSANPQKPGQLSLSTQSSKSYLSFPKAPPPHFQVSVNAWNEKSLTKKQTQNPVSLRKGSGQVHGREACFAFPIFASHFLVQELCLDHAALPSVDTHEWYFGS